MPRCHCQPAFNRQLNSQHIWASAPARLLHQEAKGGLLVAQGCHADQPLVVCLDAPRHLADMQPRAAGVARRWHRRRQRPRPQINAAAGGALARVALQQHPHLAVKVATPRWGRRSGAAAKRVTRKQEGGGKWPAASQSVKLTPVAKAQAVKASPPLTPAD